MDKRTIYDFLPIELLADIAMLVINDDAQAMIPSPPPLIPLIRSRQSAAKPPDRLRIVALLSGLDPHMRALVCSLPQLWASVYLYRGHIPSMHFADLCLRRSRDVPLVVEIFCGLPGMTPEMDYLEALVPAAHRIRSFKLRGVGHEAFKKAQLWMDRRQMPLLTEIRLHSSGEGDIQAPVAPNLRSASIMGVRLHGNIAQITRLEFVFRYPLNGPQSSALINSIAALEDLRITGDSSRFSNRMNWTERYNCPHLTALTIRGGGPVFIAAVLKQLDAPNLQRVAVTKDGVSVLQYGGWYPLFGPTFPSVNHLTIYPSSCGDTIPDLDDEDEDPDVFNAGHRDLLARAFPGITTLKLFAEDTSILTGGLKDGSTQWKALSSVRLDIQTEKNISICIKAMENVVAFLRAGDSTVIARVEVQVIGWMGSELSSAVSARRRSRETATTLTNYVC